VEYVVAELGFELRRRAVTDRLLRATGVTDYVITVLVPELAVMLAKEDKRRCNREIDFLVLHQTTQHRHRCTGRSGHRKTVRV
jgi:hypothetical protein